MALLFTRAFSFSQIIVPSLGNLAANTVYLSVRNTSEDKVLYLRRFSPAMLFTGVAGVTASVFALLRQTATPTGGSVVSPTLHNAASLPPDVEIRQSDDGLGGVAPGINFRFKRFGLPSQLSTAFVPPPFGEEDENILGFVPGECLLVVADTAIVLGARAILDFTLYQD